MPQADHPDADRLRELALGKLASAEAQRLADHLDDCPDCQAEFERCDGAADFFVELLQDQPHRLQSVEAELQDVLAAIAEINLVLADASEATADEMPAGSSG